ncbi:MAG TPA: AMP-binding protein [Clostridiales bacterium]|nr:AMP-binding protein [Clostridiales bacterium]
MDNNCAFYEIREIENFRQLFEQSAALFPGRPAFRLKGENGSFIDITFPSLLKTVYSLSRAMVDLGLSGKKIAVIGKNSFNWCCTYLAVTFGVGVIVPIDKELPPDEIANIINISGTCAIFFDDTEEEKLAAAIGELPEELILVAFHKQEDEGRYLSYNKLLEAGKAVINSGDDSIKELPIDNKALSVLLYTSGTTGIAKGVMLSQYNICSDIMMLSGVVKIYPEDVLLSILPLHHTYECSLSFLMMLYSGGCVCFCEGLRHIQRNMQEYEPTLFVTVPLMLEKIHARILKKANETKVSKLALSVGKALSSATTALGVNINDRIFHEIKKNFGGKVRMIITGAAAINPQIVKDFKTFGMPVYLGYGLTECSPLVIGNNDRLQLSDSVGVPLPGVSVKIRNPDTNAVGEILIKGPMVMLGYYEDQQATDAVFDEDGWFCTGDLGSVDEDGHYRIVGRIKNVIVTKNGKNIYPEEVEYYLNNHPFVSESIVFGSDNTDEVEDTTVQAKIFPDLDAITDKFKNKTPSKEEIFKAVSDAVKEVNKKLPKYKNIRRFDIRDIEFVKTTTNKIKRYANLNDSENK